MTTAVLEKPCGCPPKASGPVLGQKVKIMEGVTNSGAGGQRVHVADVGNWAVGRASQTVHIRPGPEECLCGITDSFARTEVDGWGESDSTYVWESSDPENNPLFSVTDPWGRLVASDADADEASDIQLPVGNPSDPIIATFQFYEDAPADPNEFSELGFCFHNTDNEPTFIDFATDGENPELSYIAAISDNVYDTVPEPDYVRGNTYNLKIQWIGKQVSAKLWNLNEPEPGAWLVQQGDPDAVRTPFAYFHAFVLDTLDTINMRTLAIEGAGVGINACLFDDFSRTETGDWGVTTPTGVTWALPSGDGGCTLAVTPDGVGAISMPSASGVVQRLAANARWTDAGGFVQTFDFLTDSTIPGTGERAQLDLYDEDFRFEFYAAISSDPAVGEHAVWNGSTYLTVSKTDWVADTWYRAKVEIRPGLLTRAKVWPRDDIEPDWEAESATADAALTGFLELFTDNTSGGAHTLTFDNWTFNTCPPDEEEGEG